MFATKFMAEGIMLIFPKTTEMTEIKEYSYLIEQAEIQDNIAVGDLVRIGEDNFTITNLGEIAQKNLVELSHITLKFGSPTTSVMPGTIYLESKEIPQIEKGTKLSILKTNQDN
jgi:PTS system glucitol/sorbitol-specific IIA component